LFSSKSAARIFHADPFVKIGFTSSIKQRLSALQVASPVPLKVLGLIHGTIDDEQLLRQKFISHSVNGEWFNLSSDIINFIEQLPMDLMWKYGFEKQDKSIMGEIKKTRLEKNLSLEESGRLIGITKQSFGAYEKSEIHGSITLRTMIKVASVFGCVFEYRFRVIP